MKQCFDIVSVLGFVWWFFRSYLCNCFYSAGLRVYRRSVKRVQQVVLKAPLNFKQTNKQPMVLLISTEFVKFISESMDKNSFLMWTITGSRIVIDSLTTCATGFRLRIHDAALCVIQFVFEYRRYTVTIRLLTTRLRGSTTASLLHSITSH